ncbi:S8 family serine peptidase [bacterium]|nr:S8 family serine peptidase [bacterium]
MKYPITLLLLCCLGATAAFAGTIHPGLQRELDQAAAGEPLTVIVHMAAQADIARLNADLRQARATMSVRHREVLVALQDAARSQDALRAELDAGRARGAVVGYTGYWISNLLVVRAAPDEILRIAGRSDVSTVEPNFTVSLIEPTRRGGSTATDTRGIGVTPGLRAMRADEVWYDLGFNGAGRLIASMDTGVDGTHPALTSRWRGNAHPASECWLDLIGAGATTPQDGDGHGTHTTGTMCGVAPDDTVGVAWGAEWIACNAINQGVTSGFDSDVIAAFQWFADPDGDPGTLDDVPDVVQNSWRVNESFGYNDCDSRWWAVIDNCEAAGVVTCWSAGNEGSGTSTMGSPADRATTATNCFSIGAVDATAYSFPYPIAYFSSRGPATCAGALPENLIKPEVVGPGVDVYSSVVGGGYQDGWDGTSMSGPHVAGAVALMRQANPDLDVDAIKLILMATALDEGAAGEDNTFGHGFIDAYAAVMAAIDGYGQLQGYVTNASYGDNPILGAQVALVGETFNRATDAAGFYSGFAAGATYTARASAPGFADQDVEVVIVGNEITTQDFHLTDIAGPAVANLVQPLATSDTVGPYTVAVDVTDNSSVAQVKLYYRIAGWPAWAEVVMTPAGGDTYTADIPGAAANTRIDFYVWAEDGIGLSGTDPAGGAADPHSLFITERIYAHDAEDPGDPGWVLGDAGDTASAGLWERDDPVGVYYDNGGFWIQPEDDVTLDPGAKCFVTGNGDTAFGVDDVDAGCTTLYSPTFDLSGALQGFVTYWRWYSEGGFSSDDEFDIDVSDDGGASWTSVEVVDGNQNSWQQRTFELVSLTDQVVLRFLACDLNSGGLVEAAIDDFAIEVFYDAMTDAPDQGLPNRRLPSLAQSRPNPFNPSTVIGFRLPAAAAVALKVFDLDGRLVKTLLRDDLPAGTHQVTWRGRDDHGRPVASGTYFYRLDAGDWSSTKRMILIK